VWLRQTSNVKKSGDGRYTGLFEIMQVMKRIIMELIRSRKKNNEKINSWKTNEGQES
jgi:predicted transcriptional regulator